MVPKARCKVRREIVIYFTGLLERVNKMRCIRSLV